MSALITLVAVLAAAAVGWWLGWSLCERWYGLVPRRRP